MIHYIVDAENKQVTAEIRDCSKAVVERLERRFGDNMTKRMEKLATISDNYRGVVRCKDGEEFNESEMIKYARWKVLEKYYTACNKAMNRVDVYLESISDKWSTVLMLEINKNINLAKNIKHSKSKRAQ